MREQHGLRFDEHGQLLVPRRRSATAEELAARYQTAQRQGSRTTQGYPPASRRIQGHYRGIQPEDDPSLEGGDFQEPARPPTSIRRWDTAQQPGQKTRSLYAPARPTRRLSGPPRWLGVALLCAGVGLFVMIVGWLLLSALGSWWQTQQDDWQYGRPRTSQIDAVVGHGDSPAHPSHFIAMNLNRHILVIELPAGDPTKAEIYLGPTLLGNGQEFVPVTVSFEVGSKPGRPDMYLHIADQTIVFLNDGKKFVAATHP